MINRDATIVQVALFLIIIAVLGVAILKQQQKGNQAELTAHNATLVPVQVADTQTAPVQPNTPNVVAVGDGSSEKPQVTEFLSSDNLNVVKQYFRAIAEKNYTEACSVVSGNKCNASKPSAVENFSTEFKKFINGYEYISIKDYGFTAPSGKDIVCVKYSYRYKDDPQPGLVSEVMSFYIDDVGGELKITDRVCEKKYKDGRGLRDCPIQANAEFCEGWVK